MLATVGRQSRCYLLYSMRCWSNFTVANMQKLSFLGKYRNIGLNIGTVAGGKIVLSKL